MCVRAPALGFEERCLTKLSTYSKLRQNTLKQRARDAKQKHSFLPLFLQLLSARAASVCSGDFDVAPNRIVPKRSPFRLKGLGERQRRSERENLNFASFSFFACSLRYLACAQQLHILKSGLITWSVDNTIRSFSSWICVVTFSIYTNFKLDEIVKTILSLLGHRFRNV